MFTYWTLLSDNELFKKLDKLFRRKNKKELCDFFTNEVVDMENPAYKEIKKQYNPYQLIEQIHLERINEKYISFTFIYIPSQDYSIFAYKDIIDILEQLPSFVFEVAFNKKSFDEQHLISMILFSNYLHMNMYTSMCDYKSVKRNSNNLYGSRMINIDLDIYNTTYDDCDDEELYQAMMPYFKQIGMEPSIFLSSGHGYYVSFILDSNINFNAYGMKNLYQNVCKKMIEVLKPFGGDVKCSDPTHVFRVPGSINLKTNEEAYIISFDVNKTISIIDLANNLGIENGKQNSGNEKSKIDDVKVIEKKTKSKKKYYMTRSVAKSKYSRVNIQRDEDLQKLLELRNYDIEGFRDLFFHIASINCFYMGMNEQDVLSYMNELNSNLISPINTIDTLVRYAKNNYDTYLVDESKAIKYTNQDIVELLAITPEEQKEMQQLIGKEEFRSRRCASSILFNEKKNNNRKQKLQEDKNALIQKLLDYRLNHLATNKDIASHFDMDERRVVKLIGKEPKYVVVGFMTRERQILYYACLNYSNKQLSEMFNVCIDTIKNVKRKYKKLGYTFKE